MNRIYYLIILLLISCSGEKEIFKLNSKTDIENWIEIINSISNKDSLLKRKPTDFLRMLSFKKLDTGTAKHKIIHNIPFKYFIHNEWVKKDDVAELMNSIYSTKISEAPWPTISSQLPMVNSTVGIEAMHLIEIYKDSTFRYPSLCSTYYLCKPEEQNKKAMELEIWWKEHLAE